MKRKLLAVCTTLAVALGLTVAGTLTAAPAFAHSGNLTVEYTCNPATGLYDGTAYVKVTNTNLVGQTRWAEGTTSWQGIPSSNTTPVNLTNGPVQSNGSETITLGAVTSLPGNTTVAPWVYAFTTWSDNYTQGRDGRAENLKGDCVKPDSPTATASVVPSDGTCTTVGSAAVSGLLNAKLTSNGGVLDTSVGSHTATFTADAGYTFVGGSKTKDVPYTVTGKNAAACAQIEQCPAQNPTTTFENLDNVDFSETRTQGFYELVEGGLHIWTTEPVGSQSKSAGYIDIPTLPFGQVGSPYLNVTTNSGQTAGLNLTLYKNGAWFGNLVKEPLFPGYWINKPVPGVAAGPNPGYQLAYGTLQEFYTAFQQNGWTVDVELIGYSLGSGAVGDNTVTKLGAGCDSWAFNKPPKPAAVPSESYTQTVSCETGLFESTRIFYEAVYTWDPVTNKYVLGEPEEVDRDEVSRAATAAELNEEGCAPPEPPTVKPTVETEEFQSCDSDKVSIMTTTTTPTFTYNEATRTYIEGKPVVDVKFTERDKNAVEAALCAVLPPVLAFTGNVVNTPLLIAGGAALLMIGGIIFLMVRYRQKNGNS